MFCAFCGHIIPTALEIKRDILVGNGVEQENKKVYTFTYNICNVCKERIDLNLSRGENGALRRDYEDKLWNQGLNPKEIEEKLKLFDTTIFGGEEIYGK